MALITLTNGNQFTCAEGTTLLDAAEAASIPLAYSCRTGRCSTCKCKVTEGTSQALHAELGLSAQEIQDGWILSCVRTPLSSMTLGIEDLGTTTLPAIKTMPCRIQSLERLSHDVIKILLRLPPSNPLIFLPGQYINIIGPEGIRRSYSLANAEADQKMLELHVRAVDGGTMSEYWFNQAKVNDLLRLNGPLGTFFLREVANLDLVFLATGTGIAPVKAMLQELQSFEAAKRPRSTTVYWGGRTLDDLYWDVTSIDAGQHYVPVLSRAHDDWTGMRGYVQDALLARHPDLSETAIYACGSDAMIHSARESLLRAGLPESRFLSDAFVCSAS